MEKDAVFCFPCRHFQPANSNSEEVFTQTGFKKWKKSKEKFDKHANSREHSNNSAKWSDYQKTKSDTGECPFELIFTKL